MIIKPSEIASNTAELFENLFNKYIDKVSSLSCKVKPYLEN